jgi:cell division protein FtsI/penicillin-binding protein 2
LVFAAQCAVPRIVPAFASEKLMDAPRKLSLFRSAHWMLLGMLVALGVSFYIGSHKFGVDIKDVYKDPYRLAALRDLVAAIEFAAPGTACPAPEIADLREKFPAGNLESLAADLQAISLKTQAMSQGSGKSLCFNWMRWQAAGVSRDKLQEALQAADWLAQGRRLENDLNWRGLGQAHATMPAQAPDSVFQQSNPWRGANGCIYLPSPSGVGLNYVDEHRNNKDLCPRMAPPGIDREQVKGLSRKTDPQSLDDPAWGIPDDLGLLLAPLNDIRIPEGLAYQLHTDASSDAPRQNHGPNQIEQRGRLTDVGFSVYLSLNPKTQALAQQWARCYTGVEKVCEDLGLKDKDSLRKLAAEMHEAAATRMVAVAIIDVASGKIEALGSAHTDCYQQDHSGLAHEKKCPNTPFRPHDDKDKNRLLNHALYVDAMPASTIKPIMALAFLQDNPAYRSGPALQALWHDLKTSNSQGFFKRLFCGDASQPWQWRECQRLRKSQEAARALGWNLGCDAQGAADCGQLDVLFGRPASDWLVAGVKPMGLYQLYGRLFTQAPSLEKAQSALMEEWARDDAEEDAGQGFRLIQDFRYEPSFVSACDRQQWSRCQGAYGMLVNEGWGQGEARVIPLGVAGMMARLAAAANGAQAQAFPHLVEHIGDAQGQGLDLAVERYAAPEPIAIDPALAKLVLQGMASHQTGGTAHSACANAFGAGACDQIDWIAGKTGTPSFHFDQYTLADISKICYATDGKAQAKCNLIPYKWYVAAFKTSAEANAPYDKAIAVLSERNWRQKTQRVQAPGDHEVNLSAELALRIIKALHPPVATPATPKKSKAKP